MSKSTLSITVTTPAESSRTGMTTFRTVEVPCRLPEAFTFTAKLKRFGVVSATAYLAAEGVPTLADYEVHGEKDFSPPLSEAEGHHVASDAERILAAIKATLGITGPVPPGSPLPAIALAYEAECASHDAQAKALQALPRALQNPGLVSTHPSERETYAGGAVGMLAQYVAWVFEQACKAQSERAEAQAEEAT